MLACLQTGDEESARRAADALTQRFGADSERVMALRGLCDEVAAGNDEGRLRKVLEGYERALNERPENLVCFMFVYSDTAARRGEDYVLGFDIF